MDPNNRYQQKVQEQLDQYKEVSQMHVFSDIHRYWSQRFVRPRLEQVFYTHNHIEVYANAFLIPRASNEQQRRYLSIGCGDGEVELSVVQYALNQGHTNFVIECMDISPYQLQRLIDKAKGADLEKYVEPIQVDINTWTADKMYDGIMAHHSLHHVVELEHLFDVIYECIKPDAAFVTYDMIGRNGHMRWPESLEILEHFWEMLPDRYKYNHQLKRIDYKFVNHDCSIKGFEGVRSQDILPLMLKRFQFERFLGYGGLTDPFVGRGYGPNFSADKPEDRAIIDLMELLNDLLIDAGYLKPTKMAATLRTVPPERRFYFGRRTPESCVRYV